MILFKCDDCTFESQDRDSFGKHYKEMHGSMASAKAPSPLLNNMEKAKLEEQLRIMKNNFERLETMYHDSLEEVNQVKSEYEAKLIKANDNYVVVKSENEILKEKIDVLFKLGRSYLNNSTNPDNNKKDTKETKKDEHKDEDNIEVIEEEVEDIENLQEWTKKKMRGFRRVNPATEPSTPKEHVPGPKKNNPTKPAKPADLPPNSRPTSTAKPPSYSPRSQRLGQGV